MDYFSQHIFSDHEKKTLDYSLWFLQNFDETMTAGYFQGGEGVIIGHYIFQKIIHPQDPLPPARTPIFPPFKISLENTLNGTTSPPTPVISVLITGAPPSTDYKAAYQ